VGSNLTKPDFTNLGKPQTPEGPNKFCQLLINLKYKSYKLNSVPQLVYSFVILRCFPLNSLKNNSISSSKTLGSGKKNRKKLPIFVIK
jgi:hypothetical protein